MSAGGSFKDQSFARRFEAMGDEAEGKFESYCTDTLKLGFTRYGLDRPPIKLATVPARVRFTPDYLTSKFFVECQGLGRDQKFKLKIAKHGALHYWNDVRTGEFDGVHFYIWDRHKQRECMLPLLTLDSVIGQHGSLNSFPEGHAYFEIEADEVFSAATS